MRQQLRRVASACAAGMLVLACFSERTTGPGNNGGARLCGTTPGANVVQIRDYAFHPAELQVAVGTTVTWVNCDADIHTSTATGGAWHSGLLSPNGTYTRKFESAGRLAYRCEPHPFMTAAVDVR